MSIMPKTGLAMLTAVTVAVVAGLTPASHAAAQTGSTGGFPAQNWMVDCKSGVQCVMERIIPQEGGKDTDYLDILVLVDKSKRSVDAIAFTLPPDADRGETLYVTFGDSKPDSKGGFAIQMVSDSTYAFNVARCTKELCMVRLQRSPGDEKNPPPVRELTDYMLNHRLMFVDYRQAGKTHKTLTPLQNFQFQYKALVGEPGKGPRPAK